MSHQYALDAAERLIQCLDEIDDQPAGRQNSSHFFSLKKALSETKELLQSYFKYHLDQERLVGDSAIHGLFEKCPPTTLASSLRLVNGIRKHRRKTQKHEVQSSVKPSSCFYEYPQRTTADTLLFRLISILQLCHVRIGDATLVLTRHPRNQTSHSFSLPAGIPSANTAMISLAGILVVWSYSWRRPFVQSPRQGPTLITFDWMNLARNVGFTGIALSCICKIGSSFWTASKLTNSTCAVEDWNRQWQAIRQSLPETRPSPNAHDLSDTEQARLLVEFALKEPKKVCHYNRPSLLYTNICETYLSSVCCSFYSQYFGKLQGNCDS
jgi:hypothetical protein